MILVLVFQIFVGACAPTSYNIASPLVTSLCARLAQENIKDDIVKTLTLLQDLKRNDLFMEVRFAVDDDGRIKSMLWCTGKNRTDYAVWGCGYL